MTKSRSTAKESQHSFAIEISQPTRSGILLAMNVLTASMTLFGTFVLALLAQAVGREVMEAGADGVVSVGVGFVHFGERWRNFRVPFSGGFSVSEQLPRG